MSPVLVLSNVRFVQRPLYSLCTMSPLYPLRAVSTGPFVMSVVFCWSDVPCALCPCYVQSPLCVQYLYCLCTVSIVSHVHCTLCAQCPFCRMSTVPFVYTVHCVPSPLYPLCTVSTVSHVHCALFHHVPWPLYRLFTKLIVSHVHCALCVQCPLCSVSSTCCVLSPLCPISLVPFVPKVPCVLVSAVPLVYNVCCVPCPVCTLCTMSIVSSVLYLLCTESIVSNIFGTFCVKSQCPMPTVSFVDSICCILYVQCPLFSMHPLFNLPFVSGVCFALFSKVCWAFCAWCPLHPRYPMSAVPAVSSAHHTVCVQGLQYPIISMLTLSFISDVLCTLLIPVSTLDV